MTFQELHSRGQIRKDDKESINQNLHDSVYTDYQDAQKMIKSSLTLSSYLSVLK